jgi:putative Holliday junction resolvase
LICLGVDPGQKRVGIALGQGSLAIALEVVDRQSAMQRILEIAAEKQAERIYVGLPISLAGSNTASTSQAVEFAKEVQSRLEIPVLLLDERLTTSQSLRNLRDAGLNTKSNKHALDAESARLLVDFAIASNHRCGELVSSDA